MRPLPLPDWYRRMRSGSFISEEKLARKGAVLETEMSMTQQGTRITRQFFADGCYEHHWYPS